MPSSVDDHDYNKINTNDLTEISSNEKISRLLDVWSSRIAHGNQIFPKDYLFKDPLIPKLKATEAFCYTLGINSVIFFIVSINYSILFDRYGSCS